MSVNKTPGGLGREGREAWDPRIKRHVWLNRRRKKRSKGRVEETAVEERREQWSRGETSRDEWRRKRRTNRLARDTKGKSHKH